MAGAGREEERARRGKEKLSRMKGECERSDANVFVFFCFFNSL
jgi:hypothetical protein